MSGIKIPSSSPSSRLHNLQKPLLANKCKTYPFKKLYDVSKDHKYLRYKVSWYELAYRDSYWSKWPERLTLRASHSATPQVPDCWVRSISCSGYDVLNLNVYLQELFSVHNSYNINRLHNAMQFTDILEKSTPSNASPVQCCNLCTAWTNW